ncbi:hypothetical protein [Streptomyces sp. NPDC051572]|uniref:hypothetical protein n=1 Tax=Streptomyces sp. NPDC051572 TaxID=3155802 RepID=UPI00345083C9
MAKALRHWCYSRMEELEEQHDLVDAPSDVSERSRWTLELTPDQSSGWAEIEHLRRVLGEANRAWAEDRWADLGALALRHRRHLDQDVVAVARRLYALASAFPDRGRAPRPRESTERDGVRVPYGVDPDTPVSGRSPQVTSRWLWALLREAFPESSSGRCSVTANRLLREVVRPTLKPAEALALRRRIADALLAGSPPPADEHERLWNESITEAVLCHVVVPLADERNRLAAAVADARALHAAEPGEQCRTCGTPSPCPTLRAVAPAGA